MLNYYNTGVTVELGELLENGVDLWDFDYPIPRASINYNGKTCTVDFDKERLQKKIEDRYRFRQIGQETTGRFLHYFRARMREIMPYYVQLYEFDAKFRNIDDPLESYNLLETFQKEHTGSGSVTGSTSSEHSEESQAGHYITQQRIFSNTPQGSIDNLDQYMSEATRENANNTDSGTASGSGSGTSEQTSSDSGTEEYTLSRRGNIGVQPLGGEVQNIRSAFINIDKLVVDEFQDLFLKIY